MFNMPCEEHYNFGMIQIGTKKGFQIMFIKRLVNLQLRFTLQITVYGHTVIQEEFLKKQTLL